MNSKIKFNNGKFKLMQISDLQDTKRTTVDTLRFIDSALEKEKPDFIIMTGDQLDVVGMWGKGEKLVKNVRKAIFGLFSVFEKHGIPYALTFGNHDGETGLPVEEQAKIYAELEHCISFENTDDGRPDVGTHNVPVFSSDGESIALNFYLMDTHNTHVEDGFTGPSEDAVNWYKSTSENLGKVPSMAFQHIPPDEVYELLKEVPKGTKGSHPAFRARKGKYYVPDRQKTTAVEAFGESPSIVSATNKAFAAMREQGDVMGIFFGHDHYNSFYGNVRGVDLGYCPGAGYNTYGLKNRAVRVFEFDENDIRNYKTYIVDYKDCCKKSEAAPIKNFIYCRAPSTTFLAKQAAVKYVGIILAVVLVLVFLNTINPMFVKTLLLGFAVGGALYGIISLTYNAIIRNRYIKK